jgi:hypothetical protein
MATPLLELDGTAEDIQKRLADFAGQKLHVTVQPLQAPPATSNGQLRPIGLCEGQFTVPDSFFDPLPDDLQRAFEADE